jgi:hypothetical protein
MECRAFFSGHDREYGFPTKPYEGPLYQTLCCLVSIPYEHARIGDDVGCGRIFKNPCEISVAFCIRAALRIRARIRAIPAIALITGSCFCVLLWGASLLFSSTGFWQGDSFRRLVTHVLSHPRMLQPNKNAMTISCQDQRFVCAPRLSCANTVRRGAGS